MVKPLKYRTLLARYSHYLHRALTLPPAETFRIIRRRIGSQISAFQGKFKVKLQGTDLSDKDFLQNLKSPFSESWETYLNHLETRKAPAFFMNTGSREEYCACMDSLCPEYKRTVITAADSVCEHVFDLLGSGPVFLGNRIDWHSDFKANYKFNPEVYFADIKYALYPGGFDIKVPWELSRCQHIAWLGQAYWFTGDEKYANEFFSQVLDWIKSNPPQKGVNWFCTMDVAIRVVNWIWGYFFFKHSPSCTAAFRRKFYKSLLINGSHIMNNLEWMEHLTSNHYLSDIVGLVYLGVLFPEFKDAEKWREFGLQELEKEIFKQVYEDGMDFEASISYHRLVLELFLSPVLLAGLNGHTFSREFMTRLEKMFEFLMHVTRPDGTVPHVGDNDNGRLHRLKVWKEPLREWNDYRYLLAIGAVLFEREDLALAAGNEWEEAVWLFGEKAGAFKRKHDSKKLSELKLKSRTFDDSGICIIREREWHMLINSGPNGQNGNAGHTHNDSLSFELYGGGTTWIIDPGTYVYTLDYDARNLFRSTLRHNTVTVDNEDQNRLNNVALFRMEDDTKARVLRFEYTDEGVIFIGEHYGYMRLEKPVTHRRTIYFDRQEDVWLIHDTFTGMTDHNYIFTLQLAPQLKVEPVNTPGPGVLLSDNRSNKLTVICCNSELPELKIDTGDVALAYGAKFDAPLVSFHWDNIPEFKAALVYGDDIKTAKKRVDRANEKLEKFYIE